MRGLKSIRSLRTVAAGHPFVENLRRGHYEHTADVPVHDRVRTAFTELGALPLTAAISALLKQ
jgi:transposase, IS6 family